MVTNSCQNEEGVKMISSVKLKCTLWDYNDTYCHNERSQLCNKEGKTWLSAVFKPRSLDLSPEAGPLEPPPSPLTRFPISSFHLWEICWLAFDVYVDVDVVAFQVQLFRFNWIRSLRIRKDAASALERKTRHLKAFCLFVLSSFTLVYTWMFVWMAILERLLHRSWTYPSKWRLLECHSMDYSSKHFCDPCRLTCVAKCCSKTNTADRSTSLSCLYFYFSEPLDVSLNKI